MSADIANTVTGEIYEAGLTPFEARELTDEIRLTLTLGHDLLIRAYSGRAWAALGYETWDAYCAGEFSEARMVRLDREQRREIVAEMRQSGMPSKSIGAALGVSDRTVGTDVEELRHDGRLTEPAALVRSDGTTYPTKPAPRVTTPEAQARSAAKPNRRPLIDGFTAATYDLTKIVERIERLCADDRFPTNAEQVATRTRGDLLRAAEALARVLDRLT